MRKIWILISLIIVLLMFTGCSIETTYWQNWEAPNWTSDGKIVFLEDEGEQKINSWGNMVGGSQTITLYEIDEDGNNLQQIREIISCDFESGSVLGPISTSSVGDWVVLSMEDWRRGDHYPVMYTVKRDGDSLSEIGSGRNPDFSPDASQIVYEKPNEGIWIMDRDGGNDHQIIADGKDPAWSPDGKRIAFYKDYKGLLVSNTSGSVIDSFNFRHYPDWGPPDSNALVTTHYGLDRGVIIYIETHNEDTTGILSGEWPIKWSPYGALFICNKTIYQRNGAEIFSLVP